jgi:hypothetical protein
MRVERSVCKWASAGGRVAAGGLASFEEAITLEPDSAWRSSECKLLKNSLFIPIGQNLGDGKCLGDPRKSILELPDAISFSSILREGVFQQPQAISLIENSGKWFSHCGIFEATPGEPV